MEGQLDPSNAHYPEQCTVEIQNLKKGLTAVDKYMAKLESCKSKGAQSGSG